MHDEQEFSHFEADTLIWKDYINQSAENVAWLEKLGVKFKGVATLGAGLNTWHMFDGLGNHAIHDAMEPFAKKNGAEYITSASVKKLISDNNKITGVVIEDYETKKTQKSCC